MPNKLGLLGDPRGEMRATPRNKLMGLLADALGSANSFATQMDPRYADKRQNQTLGLLADAVSLGSLAKTADRISYGEPLTNAGKANVPFMKPETADALMMAPLSPRNALAALGMVDTGATKAIFAGIGAKTADKAALAKAEKMAAAGADPKAIWRDTGWFKGGDGKWRFEIDDSGAVPGQRLYSTGEAEDLRQSGSSVVRRQKALLHPQLSAAYPDTKNIGVMLKASLGDNGYFNPEWGNIGTGVAANGAANRSTMLHELQHAVQKREGFAMGGTPENFTQQREATIARDLLNWRKEVEHRMKESPGISWGEAEQKAIKDYTDIGWPEAIPPNNVRSMAQNPADYFDSPPEEFVKLYGLDQRVTPYTPKEAYQRLAGEAEARAVQKRMNLSPQQRRELFPLDSYDVPISSLIYR